MSPRSDTALPASTSSILRPLNIYDVVRPCRGWDQRTNCIVRKSKSDYRRDLQSLYAFGRGNVWMDDELVEFGQWMTMDGDGFRRQHVPRETG